MQFNILPISLSTACTKVTTAPTLEFSGSDALRLDNINLGGESLMSSSEINTLELQLQLEL